MAEIASKGRGRPRKVVPSDESHGVRGNAPAEHHGVGEAGGACAEKRRGPEGWPAAVSVLSGIECVVRPLTITHIWLPFEVVTDHWIGNFSGAPVSLGEWRVQLNDGSEISP